MNFPCIQIKDISKGEILMKQGAVINWMSSCVVRVKKAMWSEKRRHDGPIIRHDGIGA